MIYGHLAHIDVIDYYQFITFRTNDSCDAFLNKLLFKKDSNSKKQLCIDQYLDGSTQGDYLNDQVLFFLHDFLKSKDGELYELIAFAIMPNHLHLLLKPLDNLPSVIRKIKGGSAKKINEILKQKGTFWAKDYYDKAIRDEHHFKVVYEYIKNNPLKLGNAKASSARFYGVYE